MFWLLIDFYSNYSADWKFEETRGVNKYHSLTPTPTLECQHSWSWQGISHVSLTWQGISLPNDQCLVKPMWWMDKNLYIGKRDMSLPIAHTMQPPKQKLTLKHWEDKCCYPRTQICPGDYFAWSQREEVLMTLWHSSVQFSSVTQLCPTFCDPMNRSTPGLPVHHQLPKFTQTHVHRVSDAIQPSQPWAYIQRKTQFEEIQAPHVHSRTWKDIEAT